MCTSAEIAEFFNNQTLSEYFALIGIKYTDSSKTGTEPYCSFDHANFLKHTFRPHPGRPGQYLAGLEPDLIYETPAWVRKSNDKRAATSENIQAALYNAHGHGPMYYDKFALDMRSLARKYELTTDFPPWTTIDENYFGGSPGIIFPKLM